MSEKERQEKILNLARKRMEIATSAVSESRDSEMEDLKFLAGSPDNQWQWPDDVLGTRGAAQGLPARPCLTINKLPQHVKQVTNDQKANRPSGKVIPVNDQADADLAEVYTGIIRHIEYISDADVAYDTACESQVTFGEGYFRILTDYADDISFDQEIKIGRIRNSFSVQMDPMIQDPCGADAGYCFISSDIIKEEYEAKYPNAAPVSTIEQAGIGDQSISSWISEKTIRVSEYFYVEHNRIELRLYPENQIVEKGSLIDKEFEAREIKPTQTRIADQKVIKWCKINGVEILEEKIWPGSFIPIIRVIGNEYEIEGKIYISGLIRNAKDPQRMYNYWTSQEAEMLALAPKAPFVGYGGQFEGYEHQWKTANTTPWPYLEVNSDVQDGQGTPLPLPTRSMPPMQQSGLIAAKMGASDDIKSTTGQYDSSLGQTSNERSGKAILARERQTDTGTYHYVDNLARAVRYATRQIIELIPKIYDTKRVARIMGMDGMPDSVQIDPEQAEAKKEIFDENGAVLQTIYNPGVGKYDIVVTTGPGYTTKRQEAAEAMGNLVQGNPDLWGVVGDLIVKGLDWPGAQEFAERLRRTIPPELLEDGPSPELAKAEQVMQEMNEEIQQMGQLLAKVQDSYEQQEINIKGFEAETKRIAAVQDSMTPEQTQDIVLGTLDAIEDEKNFRGEEINTNEVQNG